MGKIWKKMLLEIYSHGEITSNELCEILGRERDTLYEYLKRMEQYNYIIIERRPKPNYKFGQGKTYTTYYKINPKNYDKIKIYMEENYGNVSED